MDLLNSLLNLVVPPASMLMLAFAWPTLSVFHACEWLYHNFYSENMDDKVVVITGASSAIGEQIAYEYAKRRANLVLVARREHRLWGISENARRIGARHVIVMAADVVKEEDCRRFIEETINYYGQYDGDLEIMGLPSGDQKIVWKIGTKSDLHRLFQSNQWSRMWKPIVVKRESMVANNVDHLVNTTSLGHTFFFDEVSDTSVFPHIMDINFWGNVYPTFVALPYLRHSNGRIIVNASVESWLPMPRMSLFAAAKAAVLNFYETLRFEVKDEVGITITTHGWIGSEMSRGKLMLEEGAEMQWKEEREVPVIGEYVEEFAKLIVSKACQGDPYAKFPSWYDIFLVFRVFAPDVLGWTFRLLFATQGARQSTLVGTGRPLLETSSPRKLQGSFQGSPLTFSPLPLQQQYKFE